MLTPQYLLPPPEPFDYCYEWETGYGIVRKFSATPHHGIPPTRTVALYTADQMRAALAAVPAQPVATSARGLLAAWQAAANVLFVSRSSGQYTTDTVSRDDLIQLIEAAFAAAPQAVPVPAGWVLVPVEATQEMCAAAVKFANGNAVYKNVAAAALKIEEAIYGEAYAAMLAAAPKEQP